MLNANNNREVLNFHRHSVGFVPVEAQATHMVDHMLAQGVTWGNFYREARGKAFWCDVGTGEERWYLAIVSEMENRVSGAVQAGVHMGPPENFQCPVHAGEGLLRPLKQADPTHRSREEKEEDGTDSLATSAQRSTSLYRLTFRVRGGRQDNLRSASPRCLQRRLLLRETLGPGGGPKALALNGTLLPNSTLLVQGLSWQRCPVQGQRFRAPSGAESLMKFSCLRVAWLKASKHTGDGWKLRERNSSSSGAITNDAVETAINQLQGYPIGNSAVGLPRGPLPEQLGVGKQYW
ncbi:hypothetical protein N658DRAFT_488668 [Parathielavia hyrcaniae]|uniref:Uncharacterized protein n=1 Tax=Parathielavia hyrcaniae TaxID=113614 RepID=A0AAN6SZ41_9PEZI|nr:hypothetical protein N658DRAFT_488668 [Parathielavia hyrcaniae]